MNNPVDKVEIYNVSMLDEKQNLMMSFNSKDGIDGKYAHNVLDRGYNCISINFKTDKDIIYLFKKVKTLKMKTKIYSIFGW